MLLFQDLEIVSLILQIGNKGHFYFVLTDHPRSAAIYSAL
jgi:hypothetical protein